MSALLRFTPRRPHMGSITWGTRNLRGPRGLGVIMPSADAGFNIQPLQSPVSDPMVPLNPGFIQNPDTLPGVWPGLNAPASPATPAVIAANGLPQQVPVTPPAPTVVATPTSGTMPAPQVAAAAAAAPVGWLDQELLAGIPNKYLLLGGITALLIFGGKK